MTSQPAMAWEKISGSLSDLPSMNVSKTVFGPKNLTDLIRGIRAHKKNEASYISECLQEIKLELKTEDHDTKSQAVQKLTYLHLLGYDISWAAFNVIEVMSQPSFTNKRIGYLAASQTFHEGTEVVMLATSLLKKAFTNNTNQYETGAALNCLSNICTPDLARDLASDVVMMLNSSRPYLRKKAILVLYKVFLKFPEALRPSFPRLKERLEDPDPAVVSAAVNVICELARKNPKNYLPLAPLLFKILQSSQNNWMLIKLVKLFASLMPMDKRLGKRMTVPLTNFINSTTSMSLLYECIQTCIVGLSHKLPVIKLCITKLRIFIEDPDQNLKYLGLLALYNIMKVHPKAVGEHRDLVIKCLDDPDVTIRLRALDLLSGMVTKKNLNEIVKRLLESINNADGYYKNDLIEKTIFLCSQDSYKFITDFEWYISILMQLTRVPNNKRGALLAEQFMDVIIRVEAVRPYGVNCMAQLLRDAPIFDSPEDTQEVLYAAVYLVGEFTKYATHHTELMVSMLQPRVISLPAHVQAVYMQNVLKIFTHVANVVAYGEPDEDEDHPPRRTKIDETTLDRLIEIMQQRMPLFKQSTYLEVQERACFVMELLNLFVELKKAGSGNELTSELASLFAAPLNPVAPGANKKVPVPKGLDLDKQINELPVSESDSEEEPKWWQNQGADDSTEDDEYHAGWNEAVYGTPKKDDGKKDKKDKKGRKDKKDKKGRKHDKEERSPRTVEKRPYSPYVLSTGDVNTKLDHEKEKKLRGEFVTGAGPAGEQENEDEPPIVNITETFSRKVKGRTERKSRKPKVKAVVQTGFVMPEFDEGEAAPVSAATTKEAEQLEKTGLYADTDLFHVDPALSLPVPTHRTVAVAPQPKPAPAESPKEAKKKEGHRHRHGHGKEDEKKLSREERKKRHEERKKRHEEKKKGGQVDPKAQERTAAYATGPKLLDLDEPAAPARSPAPGGAPPKAIFSLDDEFLGGGNTGGASPVVPVAAPTPTKVTTTVVAEGSPSEAKKEREGGHRRRSEKDREGRSSRDKGEKKERRKREGGGDREKEHRHHHRHHREKKEGGSGGSSSSKPKREGYL